MPRRLIATLDAPEAASRPDGGSGRPPLLSLMVRLALASAMIAGISLAALSARRPRVPEVAAGQAAGVVPFAATVAAAPAAPALPPARLHLAGPAADPARSDTGRVDPGTGLREDTVTRGAFEALEAPALHFTLSRGPGAGRAPGLFVLLARRAAAGPALAVVRTGGYGRIATKFGAVETLEATLAGPVRRTCTAFVTRDAALRIDGWLCAPLGRPPEPRALGCTIDALGLDAPADPAAAAAFREADARRAPGCERVAAAPDPAGRTGSIGGRAPRTKK